MRFGSLWFRIVGRWFRRTKFVIMRHDLSEPDVHLPEGRLSPLREGEEFYLEHATLEHVDKMASGFKRAKVRHFRRCAEDPSVDFVIRLREDGLCWCYMMHAKKPHLEAEYGFKLPLVEGRDIYQFDGWVHPNFRSMMIGIEGTNWANRARRSEGYERLYATSRVQDRTSFRLHKRMGFRVVGEIHHRRFLAWKKNRIIWKAGEMPCAADAGDAPKTHSGLKYCSLP
jgi:RimJ/RimL family protein N-acetyltransferase